jgi:hypothetical protein
MPLLYKWFAQRIADFCKYAEPQQLPRCACESSEPHSRRPRVLLILRIEPIEPKELKELTDSNLFRVAIDRRARSRCAETGAQQ